MKIIISSNSAWNLYNFRYNLIRKLISNKVKVIALIPFDDYVFKLEEVGCECINLKINRKSTSLLNNFYLLIDFYKFFKKLKPDFILFFTIKPNIIGSIAANFLKIKTINTITGLGSSIINNIKLKKFILFLYKISIKNSHIVFFHNDKDRILFLKKKITNLNNSKCIAGSGIDLNKFKFTYKDYKKIVDFNFTFIGRLIKDKGILEFIEAAKLLNLKYPNVKFNIIGDIDKSNPSHLSEDIYKKLINFKFFNLYKFSKDIKMHILKSDVIVLPSYREGLSRILLEASSIGRLIIASDVPGCNDIITDNENGYLFKAKSFSDLYKTMIKVISANRDDLNLKVEKAKINVLNNFDEKKVIKDYFFSLNMYYEN